MLTATPETSFYDKTIDYQDVSSHVLSIPLHWSYQTTTLRSLSDLLTLAKHEPLELLNIFKQAFQQNSILIHELLSPWQGHICEETLPIFECLFSDPYTLSMINSTPLFEWIQSNRFKPLRKYDFLYKVMHPECLDYNQLRVSVEYLVSNM